MPAPSSALPASAAEPTGFASDSAETSSAPREPSRLRSIDFLRGAAALAVVLCHVVSSHSNPLREASAGRPWLALLAHVLAYGREGVPLFFVISGFCIHLRWARDNARAAPQIAPSVPFWNFWKRRLWRLYPPYVAALIFSLGVAWVQWKTSGRPELSAPSNSGMALDFAVHVPMLHGLSAAFDERGGNNVFWTLAREEYFYLAYFPLLWLRQRAGVTRTIWIVALAGAVVPLGAQVLAGTSLTSPEQPAWLYPFSVRNSAVALWIQWCLGMIAVEAFCLRRELPAWSRSLHLAIAWLTAGVAAREWNAWPYFAHVLWGMAFWTLLNTVVHAEQQGRWREGPLVRWLSWVGAISYSLYLVHRPFLIMWRKAELIVLGKLGLLRLESQPLVLLLEWAISLAACYAAGRIFYALIERHFVPGTKSAVG